MKKNGLKIGWARRDVSTTEPINLPGQFYMRISTGVLDPVYATALFIEDGSDMVCFVTLDLVVIRNFVVDDVRRLVAKKHPEMPVVKIILNATHTHAGPSHYKMTTKPASDKKAKATSEAAFLDTNQIPTSIKIADSEKCRDWLVQQIADAVCEAYEKRAPGGFAYGYGYATVGHSRRVTYFDDTSKRPGEIHNSMAAVHGHARMYGNTNDPKFSGYEAGTESFVNLLYTFDSKNKLTGAIINVPCPSQNSEGIYQISSSFWHDVRQLLTKKYGDIFILPQCAAAGDLSPRILHYKKAQARRFALKYGRDPKYTEEFERKDIAERIVCAFDEVLAWAKKDIIKSAVVKHDVSDVRLSRRIITDAEYEEAKQGLEALKDEKFAPEDGDPVATLRKNTTLIAGRGRYLGLIKKYEDQKKDKKITMEMHVIRLGDIAFATNRFELYMDYMHRIQARSPFTQTFIIQLTGVPGAEGGTYLPTRRGFNNRGYSASRFCNLCSPKGGQELVEATLKKLNELAD